MSEAPGGWPSEPAADDFVLPFTIEGLAVRGRIVRLGPAIERILRPRAYPAPVAHLVGEGVLLVSLIGSSLKIAATLTLQTRSDGPVPMLVADYRAPGEVRGLAQSAAGLPAQEPLGGWLGRGSLAFTIDPGGDMDRYQGIVELEGSALGPAAERYFERSEQIPAVLRLAVGEVLVPRADTGPARQFRAGGILLQRVPAEGGGGALEPLRDDDWHRLGLLMQTITDDELLDPLISPERLAYRLFHEDGVRVYPHHGVTFGCRCERGRVANILASYTREELAEFVEEGRIRMTCEFCGTDYDFDPDSIGAAEAGA